MEELAVRFAAPPPESYAASIDELQNSFFLLQAEIGSQLLPVVGESVRALSTLFDALRENDLDALPEPIQAIVRGMQSLFDGFVSVGESIRSGLGPELDLLLPAIGNLLGDILSLAGALLNALAPAYEILAVPTRVAIALIVHLADTIGSVIGAITEFVDWVTGAAASQEELQTATAATARAIGEASAALNEGSTATERFQANIKDLQTELDSVNQALAAKRQRLSELAETITSKAHPSYQQLERQVTSLEGEAAKLTAQIGKTQASLDGQTKSTEATTAATKEATVEIITYAEAIKQVQANIAAYVEEQALFADFGDFFRLARGEFEGYGDAIETVIPSLANLKNEQDAFNASIQAGIDAANEAVGDPISDYIDGLDQTSEAADRAFGSINQVGEAIRNADFRAAAAELTDFDSAFQLSEATIPKVTSAMREFTGTAPDIEKVERAVEQTTRSIDDLLDSVGRVPGEVEGSFGVIEDAFNAIPNLLIDIANDGEISVAFEDLGNTIGESLIASLSSTLADNLGGAVSDALAETEIGEALLTGDVLSATGGLGSAIGAGIAIAVAAAVTAIPIIDLINRAINPPEASTDEEIDQFNRNQFFQRGDPRRDPNFDPNAPPPVRTATRDGTRRIGTGEARQGGVASVSEGRRRRGTGPEEHENVAPPGHRYNATLGVYEPIPVIFDEDASGGSGLGVPIAVAAQEAFPGSEAGVQAAAEAAAAAAESVQMRIAAEMLYADTVQGIYNSVAEAFEAAEERKTEIIQRAAEQRVIADMRLAETQQDIYNDVVDAHETSEERKTEISERATEQRGDAEQIYVDTVQGIYNSVADAFEAAEERKTEIAERAAEQRGDVDDRLADTQQGIYNSVADAFEAAEERKTEIAERATEQRGDADDRLLDTQQGIYNSVADAYQASQDRITEISERAVGQRGDAELRYSDSVQDIHNGLFLTVTGIQEDLNDTLGDLRQQELDTEADRLDSLAELHEDTAERIADIERGQARTREDIVDRYNETRADAELRAQRQIEEINANAGLSEEERAERIARVQRDTERRRQDAGIRYTRDIEALATDRIQRLEDTQRQAAATEIQIAEQTAARVAAIQVQGTEAQTSAAGAISEAEAGAGITFADAQSAFVPAADAMTVALTTLNDTLTGINTGETEAIAGVATDFAELLVTAGVPLTDALNNAIAPMDLWTQSINTHAAAIDRINTGETSAITDVNDTLAEFIETAGVPLTDALNNAIAPMDLWTQSINTHAAAIDRINTGETSAITDVNDTLAEFIETAGVPLTEALNNAQEPMTLFATATDRLSTSLDTINDNETSLLDTETDNFNKFLDVAGVTLPDALANAVEPLDRWSTALEAHATAIDSITGAEGDALAGVDARIAEFLETAGVPLAVALDQSQAPMSRLATALETYNSTPRCFGCATGTSNISPWTGGRKPTRRWWYSGNTASDTGRGTADNAESNPSVLHTTR